MKNKKNYFVGKYYKFVSKDGFSLALIDAYINKEKICQLIYEDESYMIDDPNQIRVQDNMIDFDINQKDLNIKGFLSIGELHPLSKDVMGILRKCHIPCKHNIYSMYHSVGGRLQINEKSHSFMNGVGYIEGDEGRYFPGCYIWFNSISKDYGLTVAIADIPLLKVFTFKGSFITLKYEDHEYVFSSLNGLRIIKISLNLIELKKNKYTFKLYLSDSNGQRLYAPGKKGMRYFIHEAIKTVAGFELFYKGKLIFSRYDVAGSLERVNM